MSIFGISGQGKTCWSSLVIFFALFWITSSSSSVYDSFSVRRTNIATCRAKCLNRVGLDIFEDSQCESKPNCNMCWKTCELFYNNFTLWGPMCGEPKICFPGCQVSCGFYRSKDSTTKSVAPKLSDMEPLSLQKKGVEEELHIEWTRPEIDSTESRLVYVVMLRHNMKWMEVGQTMKGKMIVEDYRYTNEPTYIGILSFSEDGLVGQRVDVYDSPNEVYYSDQAPVQLAKNVLVQVPAIYEPFVPRLVSLSNKKSLFGVETKIEWSHPSESGNCKYEVTWKAQDSKFDIVGTLYTSYNFADIVLWPNYIHSIRVMCLEENGKISKISQSLVIDTKLARSEPDTPSMTRDCGKTFLLEALIATVSTLTFVFLFGLIFCAVKLFQNRSEKDNRDVQGMVQEHDTPKHPRRSVGDV